MWNLFDFIVKVARWLSKEAKPAFIYSSELKRTPDTARTIAKICNLQSAICNLIRREVFYWYCYLKKRLIF